MKRGSCSACRPSPCCCHGLTGPTGATGLGPTGPSGATGAAGGVESLAARVFASASQVVAADSAIVFDSILFGDPGFFSLANPTRLTAPVAGRYQITGNALFSNSDSARALVIVVNGIATGALVAATSAPAEEMEGSQFRVVTTLYELEAGDYVELLPASSGGSPNTVQAVPNISPHFMMVKV